MSPAQTRVLQDILKDEETIVTTIEYPASAGSDSFRCLKLCYMVVINEVSRHFVDWYEPEDGVIVQTREIVTDYDRPTFSERRRGVRPDGPETAYGGLIGQQPY